MRSVLNSGWTVMVLLLAGTYLLGFAGTTLADDGWPDNGASIADEYTQCFLVGGPLPNYTKCTHYDNCADVTNDPNLFSRNYRYARRFDSRPYGHCGASQGICTYYMNYPCAKLRIWASLLDCDANSTGTGVSYQEVTITIVDGCRP